MFAVCTKQPNASALLVEAFLSDRFSYEERLEFVRCWAAINGKGNLPKPSSDSRRSPAMRDSTVLPQWLVWAKHDDGWACAAAHAYAAQTVAARFTFQPVDQYPYRQRLASFLRSYASVATLSKSGQRYLDSVVRLACPGYRTTMSSTSTFLHASALIPDTINSVMSPCVHRTVSRQYADVKWSTCTPQQFLLAASILADATGSVPIYFNSELCNYKEGAALFVAHDFNLPAGDITAFIQAEKVYYASGTGLDVLGAFVQNTLSSGIHEALARTAPPPGRLAAHIV